MSIAELPLNENSALSENNSSEPNYGGVESRRRLYRLLEDIWGPSRREQIRALVVIKNEKAAGKSLPVAMDDASMQKRILGLCATIWGEPDNIVERLQKIYHGATPGNTVVRTASDVELKAAYQRGRDDLQAEIVFAERLSAIRAKYPDFDRAWASVRPLVPRVVWQEAADLEHGLEGAYQLSNLPELCSELSELEPEKARERFRHFVKDVVALGALQ